MFKTKIQIGPLTALTDATLCGTPGQSYREWQQQLEGLSSLISALLLAKAVSALNRCWEMEEQLCGLQPQDRQHDSSVQERGECTMFLTVCLKGGKATAEPKPVTNRGEQRMQRVESLPVREFCLNSNMRCVCVCV